MKILDKNIHGVSQLIDSPNLWALELWKKGCANNWMPQSIDMSSDIKQWKSNELSDDERLLVKRTLGLFAAGESLVNNSVETVEYKYITDGAIRQYLTRKAFEESLHNMTVSVCCEAFSLDVEEVAKAYLNIPIIKAKDAYLMKSLDSFNNDFNIEKKDGKQKFLKNLVIFYLVTEGVWFFSNFALLMALGRQNKLTGLYDQISYTLRDECVSKDTELLTPKGWKFVKKLSYNDKIAQYNADGTIEFVKPVKLSYSKHSTALEFTNKVNSVNLLVSNKHRLIFRDRKTNKLREKLAEDIKYYYDTEHLISGELKSSNNSIGLSPEERMMIAIQADGSIHNHGLHNGNQCEYLRVSFGLTRERKQKRLRNLIHECGWTSKEVKNGNEIIFYVNVPVKYCTKNFKDWINIEQKSLKWCESFIQEVVQWDGSTRKDTGTFVYCSTNKQNLDMVQAIGCLCKYKTKVYVSKDNRKESYKTYYRISLIKGDSRGGASVQTKVIDNYNDYLYGVEVPSGMILIRRNDSVSVTGNSTHVEFGVKLINTIKEQYQNIWNKTFESELVSIIKEGIDIEIEYGKDILPNGILGVNSAMFEQYIKYLCNSRVVAVGIEQVYPSCKNPFPWLSEAQDASGMSAFFERREKNYQNAGALKDDL